MRKLLLLSGLVALLTCGCGARRAWFTPRRDWLNPGVPNMRMAESEPLGARAMLDRNGFVVLGPAESWNAQYSYLTEIHPTFITSDAALYVFHTLFRGGLSTYEKKCLLPVLRRMVDAGLEAALTEHRHVAGDPLLGEPARRNIVLFSVAQAILSGQAPTAEARESGELLDKITAARDFGFYPEEDFTQYRPRGAYADDPELAAYFRATKWLSRAILPIILGGGDREPEASIKLRQAYLLGRLCETPAIRRDWQTLYNEVSLLAAAPDSFTPLDFYRVARRFGQRLDDQWVRSARAEYARASYPPSAICSVLQRAPGEAPSKYVQFMGERYIPDGEVHQQAVFPYVANRLLPSGLDIGHTLFGSDRADAHLAGEYATHPDLRPTLQRLRQRFETYGQTSATRTIYSEWVAAIRATVHPPKSTHVPEFFQSEAWQDKALTTALAAWAYMRHDFVLYAKEPMTPGCASMDVLVEPVPAAYAHIAKMSGMLADRGYPGMADLRDLCRVLEAYARADLAGRDPWEEVGKVPGLRETNWSFYLPSFGQWLLKYLTAHVAVEQPAVVADIAGDSNTKKVLHAGTGPLNLIIARRRTARGGITEYKGLVLSYCEFTQDGMRRLTDAEWEKMARSGKYRRYRPDWVRSYMYKP